MPLYIRNHDALIGKTLAIAFPNSVLQMLLERRSRDAEREGAPKRQLAAGDARLRLVALTPPCANNKVADDNL